MRTLFVFYSFEGNCRALARHMAEATGGDTEELLPVVDSMPRDFIGKYWAGGKGSILKETVELKPLEKDPLAYDLVIVGGPVWAWGMPPAVRSFIAGRDWRDRAAAVFSMHRGGPGSVAAGMAALIRADGGTVLGEAAFKDLRRGDPARTKADAAAWAEKIVALAGASDSPLSGNHHA